MAIFALSLSLGERSTKESMRKRYIYASPRLQDFPGVVVGCVFFFYFYSLCIEMHLSIDDAAYIKSMFVLISMA